MARKKTKTLRRPRVTELRTRLLCHFMAEDLLEAREAARRVASLEVRKGQSEEDVLWGECIERQLVTIEEFLALK